MQTSVKTLPGSATILPVNSRAQVHTDPHALNSVRSRMFLKIYFAALGYSSDTILPLDSVAVYMAVNQI